jgi:hypothetical protein
MLNSDYHLLGLANICFSNNSSERVAFQHWTTGELLDVSWLICGDFNVEFF